MWTLFNILEGAKGGSIYAERSHGIRRLPKNTPCRAIRSKRNAKKVPGHHIQADVKFLSFKNDDGSNIRRFQYTAIEDATRIRALKIY